MSASQSKRSKSLSIYKAEHEARIVRVGCQTGGKDRHSKVWTTKGARDRRVRLSVPTAIDFYDLQDRLKIEHPSGVIDWLITQAKKTIDKLPPLPEEFSSSVNVIQEGSSCASPGPLDEVSGNQASLKQVESNLSSDFGRSTGSAVTEVTEPVKYGDIDTPKSVLRIKRREKARERAKKKPNIENRHQVLVNQPSVSGTVTGLINEDSTPEEVEVWDNNFFPYSYMDMLCSQESTTMSHQHQHQHQHQQQQELHHMTSCSSATASSAPAVATPIPRHFCPFFNGSSANPQSSQVGVVSLDHKLSGLGGNIFQQQQQLQPYLQWSSIMRSFEEQNQQKQPAPTIFSNMDNSLFSLYFRGPLQSNDNNINVPMSTLVKNASHDYMDSRTHHAYKFA